jgi:hypothetical protein
LDFPDLEKIRDFLKRRRADYIEDVRVRTSDGTVIASVPEEAIGSRATKHKTSRRQLKYLKKKFEEELGIQIEFVIFRGREQEQFEAGLHRLLKNRFTEIIKDCFVSFPRHDSVEIWLDLTEESLDRSRILEDIRQTATEYLKLFNVDLAELHWTGLEKELPSRIVILKTVKASAPSSVDVIKGVLENEGFAVPSLSWLEGKLDVLRKRDMLLRQEDGSYVLTETGLRFVPHGAFRSSSDIERALALGRKKW